MTILYVNTGTSPNKGDGDTLRVAFNKINANFAQVANIINPWFLTSSTGATVVLNDNGPTGGLALNTGTWIQMAGQSGGMVLGTENTEFSDSTSSFIFSWGNAGDMVVTSIESGSGVILSDAFGSAVTVGPVKSTTGLWPGGSAGTVKITAGASTTTSTWIFDELGSLTAPGSIIPNADSLYNLGSPSKQWKDLYVSSGTIWIGGVPLTVNTANSTLFEAIAEQVIFSSAEQQYTIQVQYQSKPEIRIFGGQSLEIMHKQIPLRLELVFLMT